MPLIPERVAIPVTTGVNLTTPGRLVPPVQLLEAENSRFPRGAGATKRRGHIATRVRSGVAIPAEDTRVIDVPTITPAWEDQPFPAGWVFGFGMEDVPAGTVMETSLNPTAGLFYGAAKRDDETLVWDGHRLFSRTTTQSAWATTNAVLPRLRSEVIAKTNTPQAGVQAGCTGRIRVVAWMDDTTVTYTVLDSATDSIIVPATAISGVVADHMRVLTIGAFAHIIFHTSGDIVSRYTINHNDPRVITNTSLGACTGFFDFYKVTNDRWVFVRNDDGDIRVSWHRASGLSDLSIASSNPTVGVDPQAIAIASSGSTYGIAWRDTDEGFFVRGAVYALDGSALSSEYDIQAIDETDLPKPITLAFTSTAPPEPDHDTYNAWFDWVGVAAEGGLSHAAFTASAVDYLITRFHLYLGSSAFSVGSRSFVWAGFTSPFQSSWFLLDDEVKPVGRVEYITANVDTSDTRAVMQVNSKASYPTVFNGGYGCRIRVAVEPPGVATNGSIAYADPSIKFYELDMLPPLRAAQAGRALYFAGAQVWSYDGLSLTEAGFHLAPEGVTGAPDTGGAMTAGDYIYRVDLCSRNAFNEEHRSASFYTSPITVASSGQVVLSIPTVLTRRDDSYFLIYRNEAAGTQWYLINSRDPDSADFVPNDLTAAGTSWTDTGAVTSASLILRELHPANGGFGYLDQFTAPACEIIASGHDRLWVAGGEIPFGQVHPSRLYIPTEAPSFNAFLAIQIDRAAEPITAIGFVGETRAYFRRTQCYVQQGDGPDNSSRGTWETARLAYADVGAVGPEGLGLISAGLLFQSPAGIRLLSAGGGLSPVGQPVDTVTKDLLLTGTVISGPDQEARFYHSDGCVVFNYQYGTWSTWTVGCAGVVLEPDGALLAKPNGRVWKETEGLWLDDGHPYRHRIRFAWLRRGDLMDFQRVRRIGAVGEADPANPHNIHVDVYYDEREFPEEVFDWTYPDPNTQNTDEFGGLTFGSGAFGDTGDTDV